jgi:hypothetical protein
MVGHRYTEEEHKFLRTFIPGHTYKEIVAEYNRRFSEPITETRVKGYMANHKINNGLTGRFKKGHIPANKGTHPKTVGRMGETQYKKGNLPHNTKPIGYERLSRDGYIEVKIAMRPGDAKDGHNFVGKHRLVWEKAHGPIPDGHKIIFLDGDKQNCNIENLALVSNAELLQMTRKGLKTENAELTKTVVLIARAGVITNKFNKRKKDK